MLLRFKRSISKKDWILLGIFIFAFILRLSAILQQPLWHDEAFSIYVVKFGHFPYYDVSVPPLNYILLKFLTIFSTNYFILRIRSLLFSLLSLVFIYLLAKKIINKSYALIVTILLTLSPFQIHYSWQIREYALFLLLVSISLYLCISILEIILDKKDVPISYSIALIITDILGSLCSSGYFVYLLSLMLFLLIIMVYKTTPKKQKAIMSILLGHLIIPVILIFYWWFDNHNLMYEYTSWIAGLTVRRLATFFLVLGDLYPDPVIMSVVPRFIYIPFIIYFVIMFFGLILLKKSRTPIGLFIVICTIVTTVALIFSKPLLNISIMLPRLFCYQVYLQYFLVAAVLYYGFIFLRKSGYLKLMGIIIMLCFALRIIYVNYKINIQSYYLSSHLSTYIRYVQENIRAGDHLLVIPRYLDHVVWYNWNENSGGKHAKVQFNRIDNNSFLWENIRPTNFAGNLYVIVHHTPYLKKEDQTYLSYLRKRCRVQVIDDIETMYCVGLVSKNI